MICCVTGHRPKGFPFPYNADNVYYNTYLDVLEDTIEDMIYEGYTHFISGMADGVDLDFASIVSCISINFEGIILESALPYPLHIPIKSTERDEERNMLVNASQKITVVSPQYFKGCMQKRNRYMVDSSDLVLAVWNGEECGGTWDTIKYARKKGKNIRYIMLKELTLEDREKSLSRIVLVEEIRRKIEENEKI